jgi:hypothetical protein
VTTAAADRQERQIALRAFRREASARRAAPIDWWLIPEILVSVGIALCLIVLTAVVTVYVETLS